MKTQTYLVINFDRYRTSDTTRTYLEATSHKNALQLSIARDIPNEDEAKSVYEDSVKSLEQVSDDFACLPSEESDTLIYKLS